MQTKQSVLFFDAWMCIPVDEPVPFLFQAQEGGEPVINLRKLPTPLPILAVLISVSSATGLAAEPVKSRGIYDDDAAHLWNRLHRAVSVRIVDGLEYGMDHSVPFLQDAVDLLVGDAHGDLIAVLDEFLAKGGEKLIDDPTKRALLQHDLWAAFDLACPEYPGYREELKPAQRALRVRLAKVIARLALTDAQIKALPDNYAAALKSGQFAADYDPKSSARAFLPADLFDPKGPWVEIGNTPRDLVAPVHVEVLDGRSAFLVFIRAPGGREATLQYLNKLNLHPTPWILEPAPIATVSPDNHLERQDPLRLDPKTPQFPEGTAVALIRQMLVVNDLREPVCTPIVQSLQFRVFKKIPEGRWFPMERARELVDVFEVTMRRAGLLAGQAGGLHAIRKDEAEYQMIRFGPPHFENEKRESRLRGERVLSTCTNCHRDPGIFSVNTFNNEVFGRREIKQPNPKLFPLPADYDPDNQRLAAVQFKRKQYDWGVLRGLLDVEQ